MARIDKYLWAVRLFKTRSLSAEACKKNRVLLNQLSVKASKEVKINDIITIKKAGLEWVYQVIDPIEKRVGAKLVPNHLLDLTPDDTKEKYRQIQLSQQHYRDKGLGRPTKKDRRDIDKYMN